MSIGSKVITSSDALVDSTNPTVVYAVIVKSGGTAASVLLKLAATGGQEYDQIDGTINKAIVRSYPGGLLFPTGCFVDLDANTTYVTVIYERI